MLFHQMGNRAKAGNRSTEHEFMSGFTLQIFVMKYYDELIRLQPCGCSKVGWIAQAILLSIMALYNIWL